MHRLKNILPIVLATAILLCGCDTSESRDTSAPANRWRIGISCDGARVYDDTLVDGFSDAINDELLNDTVTFTMDYISSEKTGRAIMHDFIADGDDLIFTIGDDSLNAAGLAADDTTVIGIDSMPNLPELISLCIEVTPHISTLGILYGKNDTHSAGQIRELKTLLGTTDIRPLIYQLSDDIDNDKIKRIVNRCDAIYIPAESTLPPERIARIAAKAGVPTIGGDVTVGESTLFCLLPDYYAIGYEAGKEAAKILSHDKRPETITIEQRDFDCAKLYNKDLAKLMELSLPKSFHEYDPKDPSSVFSDQ